MKKDKMPHEGHENHLCYLQNIGYLEEFFEEYEDMVKDARFICKTCGRVAEKESYICKPKRMEKQK
jgi:hypothetical protein